MTIIASLKALLFAPAQAGAAAGQPATAKEGGFAALLDRTLGTREGKVTGLTLALPLPLPILPVAEEAAAAMPGGGKQEAGEAKGDDPPVVADDEAAAIPVFAMAAAPVPPLASPQAEAGAAPSQGATAPSLPGQPPIPPKAQESVPPFVQHAEGEKVSAPDALALLQIVQRQAAGQADTTAASTDADSARRSDDTPSSTPPVASAPPPLAAPASPAQPQPGAPAAPVPDLSASIGGQIVDMGVSGQWIDRLAHDIAGLSADGAQGRFQLQTEALGSVQVDIRHGAEGAAISLTVATEAAETALRRESAHLRVEAEHASVRIADVRIERAPVAEAARSDGGLAQQQQQHQHPGHGGSHAWQGTQQGMGQPSGQGRWQQRENIVPAHKAPADPAVLNHEDAARPGADAARARYA